MVAVPQSQLPVSPLRALLRARMALPLLLLLLLHQFYPYRQFRGPNPSNHPVIPKATAPKPCPCCTFCALHRNRAVLRPRFGSVSTIPFELLVGRPTRNRTDSWYDVVYDAVVVAIVVLIVEHFAAYDERKSAVDRTTNHVDGVAPPTDLVATWTEDSEMPMLQKHPSHPIVSRLLVRTILHSFVFQR